eukprot:6277314-Amphidinium_carterae.1
MYRVDALYHRDVCEPPLHIWTRPCTRRRMCLRFLHDELQTDHVRWQGGGMVATYAGEATPACAAH